MKFFIYSRKSVYTGRGESVENQVEMCRQYIRGKYPGAADCDLTVYEDEGFSAKDTDRPQFKRMLADIRREKPDFVVCYRLDRISRNVSDFSALIEELNSLGISFLCIREEFDTSKPMGKAMMYIASVFAQLERETIAERVRDNMLLLARTGRWLGGATPTGFTSEKIQEVILDGKQKTSCKLKEEPGELWVVDMIFETFLEVRSVSGVSKHLIRQGVRSRGGAYYSLPGIKQILQNPVYCAADRDAFAYLTAQGADVCFTEEELSENRGLLAYNKRDYRRKSAPRQGMDKWIVAVGKHKGRIPGRDWVAVQRILAASIPTGKKTAKAHNGYALLSGLIYCGQCGGRMFAKRRTGDGADRPDFDYVCGSKLRGGTGLCACQNLNGRNTDYMVCRRIAALAQEDEGIFPLLEQHRRELAGQLRRSASEDPAARRERCAGELDRLANALSQPDLSPALLQRINTRARELEGALDRLSREQGHPAEPARGAEELEQLAQELASLPGTPETLSLHEQRDLVKLLVSKIVWTGQSLHLFLGSASA